MASNPTINTRADSHETFIPEVWAQVALDRLRSSIVLANLVSKDAQYGVTNIGDTVNIRKRGTLTGAAIGEGAESTVAQTTGTVIPVLIDQTWEVEVGQSDLMKALSDPTGAYLNEYMGDAAQVIAERIESTLINEYANLTSTTIDGDLDETKVLTARKQLFDAKAPKMDGYNLVTTSSQYNKLLALDRFTAVEKYGPNTSIANGELGRIHNFRTFEHTSLVQDGSPSKYQNMFFHKDAIVLAMRELPVPSSAYGVQAATVIQDGLAIRVMKYYDTRKKQECVNVSALWGVKTVRPEFGGVITTAL
jgi:N4-gp56 family major capsid protein